MDPYSMYIPYNKRKEHKNQGTVLAKFSRSVFAARVQNNPYSRLLARFSRCCKGRAVQ
jgi:hypothetical protein